jgi:drug/metabolite transporter superfamily protein YnfA
MSGLVQGFALLVAALLEVGGDALIRGGLHGKGSWLVVTGFLLLGSYGLAVNSVPVDFSKLLGAYVGLFALVSVLAGKYLFAERIAASTWVGLGVVLVGSLIIQCGLPL